MILRSAGLVAVLLALAALPAAAQASGLDGSEDILGVWLTEGGKSHVEISEQGGEYRARITWLRDRVFPDDDEKGMAGQPVVDRENPDPALRDRDLIGIEIMWGFRRRRDNLWSGGRIYDPENGKTYRCKMWLDEDGVLRVRGYVGLSLLGRTTEWTPVVDCGE